MEWCIGGTLVYDMLIAEEVVASSSSVENCFGCWAGRWIDSESVNVVC